MNPDDRHDPAKDRLPTHLLVVAAYAVLAVAVSWPLARDFNRYLIGDIFFDQWHAIWNLWYQREVFLGRAAWPYTTLLFFPHGIDTLVDGVGPVNGVLALPFWPWGPVAAFNGASLAGLTLSAWCAYLLARHLRLDRAAAFVAGAVFTLWPLHLAALAGHLEKVFVGFLPLALLAGLIAFDHRRRWPVVFLPGVVLLGLLFQNGNQFTFGVLGLVALVPMQLAGLPRAEWMPLLRRVVIAGVMSIAMTAPALVLVARASAHPAMQVKLGSQAPFYSPDVLQFVVPGTHQAWLARALYPPEAMLASVAQDSTVAFLSATASWYGSGVETAVAIPIAAMLLCAVAVRSPAGAAARGWLAFALFFTVLSAGPYLRIAGATYFGNDMTIVALPYALLQRVPGFDVMRTPGRLMMTASVGFALAAAMGFHTLRQRARPWGALAAAAAVLLLAAECWPLAWPQRPLPPVSGFYHRLAADGAPGAVLDLPAARGRTDFTKAGYTLLQTVHRRPIAWGYLSRDYLTYPVPGLESLWDPGRTDHVEARARLYALGYRYVIWHKYAALLGDTGRVGELGRGVANVVRTPMDDQAFYRALAERGAPIFEDALIAVHCLGQADTAGDRARCR